MKRVDPLRTPIVFNCGMGAVRTTYAMVAACLIRRRQYISLGMRDPFLKQGKSPPPSLAATPGGLQAVLTLEQAEQQKALNESLLKLAYLLQNCKCRLFLSPLVQSGLIARAPGLSSQNSASAIELLVSQPTLQHNLVKALNGNYQIVLSLLGCIDKGLRVKQLVDRVINACDQVVDLRQEILVNRLKYSLANLDDQDRTGYLKKAAKALER